MIHWTFASCCFCWGGFMWILQSALCEPTSDTLGFHFFQQNLHRKRTGLLLLLRVSAAQTLRFKWFTPPAQILAVLVSMKKICNGQNPSAHHVQFLGWSLQWFECPVRMSICNKWNTHTHIVAQSWWWSEPANWWCKLCTIITVKASGLASTARTLNELSSPKVKPPPSIWTCHCQLLHVGSCMAFFASLLVFLIFPEVALERLVVNSIWIENARKQCHVLPHGKVWSEGMFGGYTGTRESKANGNVCSNCAQRHLHLPRADKDTSFRTWHDRKSTTNDIPYRDHLRYKWNLYIGNGFGAFGASLHNIEQQQRHTTLPAIGLSIGTWFIGFTFEHHKNPRNLLVVVPSIAHICHMIPLYLPLGRSKRTGHPCFQVCGHYIVSRYSPSMKKM